MTNKTESDIETELNTDDKFLSILVYIYLWIKYKIKRG